MNDNLDDWLNSIGVPIDPEVRQTVPAVQNEEPASQEPVQPQSLSEDDLDDILEDFGFTRPEEAQAEKIHDGSDDEGVEDEEEEENTEIYQENNGETGTVSQGFVDLDAEEDADWQEAIDSGGVVPVPNYDVVVREPENINPHLMEMADSILSEASTPQEEPLIPLNSPTLLMDESTTRFSGAEWFNEIQKKSIIIGGCGGIGSNMAFQLARMHPAGLYLYDDDTVETVNMAGQLFSRNDVGKSKVAAISDMISLYTNMQGVYALRQKFTENTEAGDIMLCGFDNMEARKIFFRSWTAHIENKSEEEKKNCLFLDGRLSLDTLQVLCLTGDDYANQVRYAKEFLFSDAQAEHTVCSMKQTTYLACMIGSIMVNLFTNFCANLLDPVIPYDLPFFTEYDAQNMIFKTEK